MASKYVAFLSNTRMVMCCKIFTDTYYVNECLLSNSLFDYNAIYIMICIATKSWHSYVNTTSSFELFWKCILTL